MTIKDNLITAVTGPCWRVYYCRNTRCYRLIFDDNDLLFFDLNVACVFACEYCGHSDFMQFYRLVRSQERLIAELYQFCSGLKEREYLAMRPNILAEVIAHYNDCPDNSHRAIFNRIVAKYAPSYQRIRCNLP